MGQYINENIEYIERIRYRIKEFLFSVHNSKTRLKEVISNLEDSESVFNSILLYTYLNVSTRDNWVRMSNFILSYSYPDSLLQ